MKLDITLWNIHHWLLQRDIPHMYIFEDELDSFSGIRFYSPENDTDHMAVLYNETHSHQYRSVLSYQNSRIYFQNHSAHEAMKILTGILTGYASCIRQIKDMNLNRCPLSDILEVISDFLGYPFILVKDTRILACTPGCEETVQDFKKNYLQQNIFDAMDEWIRTTQANSFTYPQLIHSEQYPPVFLGRFSFRQNFIWIFGIGNTDGIHYGNLNLFQTFLQYIQQSFLLSDFHSFGCADETERYLLECINHTGTSQTVIPSASGKLHWQKDDFYTIYRIELFNGSDSFILNQLLMHLYKVFPKAYAMIHDSGIYLFWNKRLCGAFMTAETFRQILPMNYLFIGQSNIQNDFSVLPALIHQAKEAVAHGRNQNCHFLFSQEISKDMLSDRLHTSPEIQALVHPAVKYLLSLDNASQGKKHYLDTLKTYLLSGANLSLSAKKLHLHRNTLISRIHKIETLTGINFENSSLCEALLLSVMIL